MRELEQLFLWNSIERKCLYLLQQRNTLASVLQIHAFMLRNALETNVNLLTKFITTCASLAGIHHARSVFDNRPHRDDTFLCNSMIKCHVGMRQFVDSFTLYRDLRRNTGFVPDSYTFTTLGKSCGLSLAILEGQEVHGHVVKIGFCLDLHVSTALVDMYAKFGKMGYARMLFDEMSQRSEVSWTALICGYEMQSTTSLEPDEVTIVCILPAIADLGALDLGGWVHRFIRRKKLDRATNVCTALVDVYAKCGEVTKARRLFDEMPEKETASWNALIYGFAVNGCAKEALDIFSKMQHERYKPNDITMLGVLSACNHSGLVEEGKKWFKAMEEFRLIPKIEHYGCMVDLLGRAGCLEEAEQLIERMPYKANGTILSSFLFACGCSKDTVRAERVLNKAVKMEPHNDGNYVMLRNLYATEERWRDVEEIKGLMRKNGANKEVACSIIEVDGRVREFLAGERLNPHLEAINLTLDQLKKHMKGQIIKITGGGLN
ncbi:pentatricopeptide repeat-containing protein [Quercus suber]|uniref:Pentatricopeptide repeat-containing protein n=1 Tax=Quercus suber TaxID=58331 RepID=A0AAW0KZM7_QUESU